MQVRAYRFNFPNSTYCVQDIGTFLQKDDELRISVAGFITNPNFMNRAWHGYVVRLSNTSTMENNYYYDTAEERFEHYKIRYNNGEEYTGGYFQGDIDGNYSMGALFGSPLKLSDDCNKYYTTPAPKIEILP